jgi:hypothetical protein
MNAVCGKQRREPAAQGAATDGASKLPLQLQEGEASRVPKQDVLNPLEFGFSDSLGHWSFYLARYRSIWQVVY